MVDQHSGRLRRRTCVQEPTSADLEVGWNPRGKPQSKINNVGCRKQAAS